MDLVERLRATESQERRFATNRTARTITCAVDALINPDGPEAADRLESLARLQDLLLGGTLSVTSFDGHAVRIDFETRAEANELSILLTALGQTVE